jgi:hypothetical protein
MYFHMGGRGSVFGKYLNKCNQIFKEPAGENISWIPCDRQGRCRVAGARARCSLRGNSVGTPAASPAHHHRFLSYHPPRHVLHPGRPNMDPTQITKERKHYTVNEDLR